MSVAMTALSPCYVPNADNTIDHSTPDATIMDSVTHVLCTPRVCGVKGDEMSSVTIHRISTTTDTLIDGGSNVCVTGDLHALVDVSDITPIEISVALEGVPLSTDNRITKRGLLPITLSDGNTYYQPCFYCANMVETIISPAAVLTSSDVFYFWNQEGCKDSSVPGRIKFTSRDGTLSMHFDLQQRDGLYYCNTNAFAVDHDPVRVACHRTNTPPVKLARSTQHFTPTSKARQVESEVWMLRLGSPGEHQLDVLPLHVTGTPTIFEYHPFRSIDFKEQAYIRKQAANRTAERIPTCGAEFFMDFAFMRSSTNDYKRPNKATDRIVTSYDGYSSHLIIVDGASRRVWVFLTMTKEPPIDILRPFMTKFGIASGVVRTDQGGELARSTAFRSMLLKEFSYVVEPTGADSPSQNGGAEIYNNTLAVKVRTLLYGSGLTARFWSAALLHSVYLYNRLVHSATGITPYEGWYGRKPDVSHLKTFGSRVCVKRTGSRRCKLDRHDFTGIFLGYTATDQNIIYLDLDSGIVKTCHHAVFDEAWYLQPTRPPAPQLLYDLGLEADTEPMTANGPLPTPAIGTTSPISIKWPPLLHVPSPHPTPPACFHTPLPLRVTDTPTLSPNSSTARAARLRSTNHRSKKQIAADVVAEYFINASDMATVYISPDPYGSAFEEDLNLRKFDLCKHRTAGLCFFEKDGRIFLASMAPSTPGAQIPRWRSRIRGAWLVSIDGTAVHSIAEAQQVFHNLSTGNTPTCTLLFSHPEVSPDISNKGLPILSQSDFSQFTHDQLNNRLDLLEKGLCPQHTRTYDILDSGDVLNYTTRVMKLTRGKLLRQADWDDWQQSEYLQLDQYDSQGMFGNPVPATNHDAIFHLVWTYAIKTLDHRKKARCVCDGSSRSGSVQVLDETYANCVDQTSSRLFYAIAAAENMLIFGSDVSNAFAEAPPPKQGFFIRPDRAFHDWWTKHKQRPPLPDGYVIPILSAMQGHPESPRLWEKHADAILKELGLTPTIHEPCLYSGIIENQRVILKRQVDDFAIAAPDERTANILLDKIDDNLSIPLKRQGLLDMFNGLDITQTRDYIKIDCHTYVNKFSEKYLDTWLNKIQMTENRPTPLPTDQTWIKKFNAAVGPSDPKEQAKLSNKMQLKYKAGIGELIWAMTTCRPDLAFTSVKLSQSNSAPAEHHYHGLKHAIRYLYTTRNDGIYFWRTRHRPELPEGPLPTVNSNRKDLLLDNRPHHDALTAVAYGDSDWATCVKTRRSFSGICIQLAGGTIAYKTKFQPTVALSSTEAEFMTACDVGRMCLFVRSILWDLDIPQEAATVAYEDNDGCTAMANAQKPTTRTRHIDIKHFALCDWVERDLILLDRIDTSINIADHLTKILSRILFHRHADYLLGHIPPKYSPVYQRAISTYSDKYTKQIDQFVPVSFTTPTTAKAARTFAPIQDDIKGNPWLTILWHECTTHNYIVDCGGVLVYT